MMNQKSNVPEVYLPGAAKNYTYYPIEARKQMELPTDRGQPTIRVDRYRDRQLQMLRSANEQMREREQIYIDKLMKLQEGLQNQYREFVHLQQLYTELFESYKQKELEITELEFKYRESSRRHYVERMQEPKQIVIKEQVGPVTTSQEQEYGLREMEWVNREKEWIMREGELMELNESLTEKLLKVNQSYEKVLQQQAILRSKQKVQKGPSTDKMMQQIEEWQRKAESEKEVRLKFQYQIQFLKSRNMDLQVQREELQKLLTYKQTEIAKLREQKIHIHRQTSQKIMNRSVSSSSRVVAKADTSLGSNGFKETSRQSVGGVNDQSMVSQTSRTQPYFSFSREKRENSVQEGLPNIPPELQIDSLINEHLH